MARKAKEVGPGEVARLYRIALGTLANWRAQGIGPAFRKRRPHRNAAVAYNASAVIAWGKANGYLDSREIV